MRAIISAAIRLRVKISGRWPFPLSIIGLGPSLESVRYVVHLEKSVEHELYYLKCLNLNSFLSYEMFQFALISPF